MLDLRCILLLACLPLCGQTFCRNASNCYHIKAASVLPHHEIVSASIGTQGARDDLLCCATTIELAIVKAWQQLRCLVHDYHLSCSDKLRLLFELR